MKRLLRVGFDYALSSIFPLSTWVVLSIVLDSRLMNVFSLTYPFQFISSLLSNVFSTGANISGVKDKNKNAVMSGLVVGSCLGFIAFGIILLRIEKYLTFMSMDIAFYKNFTVYSLVQIYLQTVVYFVMNKLYYEGKNELANKYSVIFNVINFVVVLLCVFIFGNSIITVCITLFVLAVCVIVVLARESNAFRLQFSLIRFIECNSMEVELEERARFFSVKEADS